VLGAAVEGQRGADEVAAFGRRVVEVVGQRARVEHQAWLAHRHAPRDAAAGPMRDRHLAAPHHVQEAQARLRGEACHAAQRPVVEQLRAHAEALEQCRETVDAGRIGLFRGLHEPNRTAFATTVGAWPRRVRGFILRSFR
jgi:hypothetical protein